MITEAIITVVVAVVQFFSSLLPSLTVPSWFTSNGFTSTIAGDIGDVLSLVRPVFPVDAFLGPLQDVMTLLPVIIGYVVFQWAWDHCPTIAGFGTK